MDIEISSDLSPYLKGIQNLSGETPAQKHQYLNATIKKLLATTQDNEEVVRILKAQNFPDSIIPLVQILIGNRTKSYEAVLNALKSTDYKVVRKALQAKWFFNSSNEYLQIDFFLDNIMPHLSVRNRYKIVNVISRCFVNSKKKAESFFEVLSDQYELKYALPFLPYCSEIFIFNVILEKRICLSDKLLNAIYRVQPKLAIRYLHLGNEHNMNNIEERKIHKININLYGSFLPKIVKAYPQDFLDLLHCLSPKTIRLSNKSSNYLCKFAGTTIAQNSTTYVNILSLKSISNCLGEQLFEEFYMNLFSTTRYNSDFHKMLNYLRYHLTSGRLQFMMDKFQKRYSESFISYYENSKSSKLLKNQVKVNLNDIYSLISQKEFETLYLILFNNIQYLENDMLLLLQYYPKEKRLELLKKTLHLSKKNYFNDITNTRTTEMLELFPNSMRETIAAELIERYGKNSSQYFEWCCYLPLKKSYDILKTAADSSKEKEGINFIKKMIDTCFFYDDQKHLLLVMTYFRNVCAEYPNVSDIIILEYLAKKFSIKSLNESNWQIFYELLLKIYVKDQLCSASEECVEKILHEALNRLFYQVSESPCESILETSLHRIMHMYLEYKIELRDFTEWKSLEKYPALESDFICRIIKEIPTIYPESHVIWKENSKKIKILIRIFDKIIKYNCSTMENEGNHDITSMDIDRNIIKIQNHPWLLKSTIDVLKNENENDHYFSNFKSLVKQYDAEFYLSIISQIRFHSNDIVNSEAQLLLKMDKQKVISNWKKYLSACQKLLCSSKRSDIQAAKKFILSTIWYQDLPVKMVNQCLLEIHEPGSLKILGLYLDGQSLNKITSEYYPKETAIDTKRLDARQIYRIQAAIPAAINVSEPPVALEIFCQFYRGEYFTLAKRSIMPLGQRIGKSQLITVATHFVENADNLSKYGIHLIFQISSNDELYEFLKDISTHHSLNRLEKLITRKIFNRFKTSPTPKTWILINYWIDILKADNDSLKILCKVSPIINSYTQLYITKLFNKIEELQKGYNMEDPAWKENYVETILKNIRRDQVVLLSRKTILDIMRRYYSKTNSYDMKYAVKSFGNIVFTLSFDTVKSLRVS